VALTSVLACAVASAQTQSYPARPVTMIVPFPAGGGSDILARIVADGMRQSLGQPVIIENVGGAGGTIGTTRVARRRRTATLSASANGPRMSAPARSIR
jgi:tripartite-type tricarboxylate transporter receptor subunit TctC